MPPPQTTDLALLTARVQKAVTQHSVNAHEFGKNIYDTLRITGVDLEDEDGASAQEGKLPRKKARVVVETTVRKGERVDVLLSVSQELMFVLIDFLNPVGVLHGAATAYIIDMQVFLLSSYKILERANEHRALNSCSSLPLMALSTSDFWSGLGGLSQSMQILYHAPAPE